MKKNFLIPLLLLSLFACKSKDSTEDEEGVTAEEIQTPVTVTSISTDPITEYVELNATSLFVQDNIVKSNINGYIKEVNTKLNQYANAGKVLFVLKTKEAQTLGNTINKLDPSFEFTGTVKIPASQSGFVTELNHQIGDYVQDGEQLAVISDSKSFGFVLNIPYELHKYISLNKKVEVILPDGTNLPGTISAFMPTVDSASQTQQAMVKVANKTVIPENLIAKVRILKSQKSNATSLPKEAILTDEAQTSFWIMKMIDSVTAVKIPIVKGMEAGDQVEIVRPQLSPTDKILVTGNYGLSDTAKVKIVQE